MKSTAVRQDALLSLKQLSKRYVVTVLDRVSLELRAGEIHAIIGVNGAGKSTLCRMIAGLIPTSGGGMYLAGRPYAPKNKAEAERAGVQIVQQELNLIPTLSVAENVMLNRLPCLLGCINYRQLKLEARKALDRIGLTEVAPEVLAGLLGVGQQQMVEIAASLHSGGRVLILDEPTATLSAAEVERLFQQLRRLRESGVGIIYISHRLDEITDIADRVTVLRDGRWIATASTASLSSKRMIELMTDDSDSGHHDHINRSTEHETLRVEKMTRRPVLRDVSFVAHRGERLGIAGLVGSGRTELLRAIFGADATESGAVYLDGNAQSHRFTHPRQATRHGLAMLTEDRKQDGLLISLSICLNTTLSSISQFSRRGVLRPKQERCAVEHMTRQLDIRCRDVEQSVCELSGGNQQKVAIAKWLQCGADVFLFDEPTRGIDISSRQRIYQLFDTLAAAGKTLVIVSSDTDELMQTCDSILVMSAGKLVARFDRPTWSREAILQAAFRGYLSSGKGADFRCNP